MGVRVRTQCPGPEVLSYIEILRNCGFLVGNREVSTFFQQLDLGLRRDFTPRVSRPDKTNAPPGADFFDFSLRVQL